MNAKIKEILELPPIERAVLFPVNHHPFIDTAHLNTEIQQVYSGLVNDIRVILSKMNSTTNRTYVIRSFPKTDDLDQVLLSLLALSVRFGFIKRIIVTG